MILYFIINVWWIVCRITQVWVMWGCYKAYVCVSLSECLYVFMFSMWVMCMSVGTTTALYKGLLLVQSQSTQNAIVTVYNKGQRGHRATSQSKLKGYIMDSENDALSTWIKTNKYKKLKMKVVKQCMHTGLTLIKNTDLLLGLSSETGISRSLRCSV